MVRVVLLVSVTFFVTACGVRQERNPWPAHVTGLQAMSEEEKSQVVHSIQKLNSLAQTELVILGEDSENDVFVISIRKSMPDDQYKLRAGFAVVDSAGCSVDLSSVLFEKQMTDYVPAVVLHELGHCAGLEHSEHERDVMYRTTLQFSQYSSESIQQFIHQIREAAGL